MDAKALNAASGSPSLVYRASHMRASTSVKKARPVIDLIRRKRAAQARDILRYTPKRAAYYIDRVIQSAIANAENSGQVDVDDLVVWRCWIDEGPARPGRWKFAAHGRVRPIRKRTSHICVELAVIPEAIAEKKVPRRSAVKRDAKKAKE